jgi:hypothetical protein
VVSGIAKEVLFILDFWHASEHLQEFANVFAPDEDERRKRSVDLIEKRLRGI